MFVDVAEMPVQSSVWYMTSEKEIVCYYEVLK